MGRKIISVFAVAVLCLLPLGSIAQATDYTTYDGNLSSTYTTYFKDILSNAPITSNYVYFRSGQNDYKLIIGDLEYINNKFTLIGQGKEYTISTNSNYNSYYSYSVVDINHFTLSPGNKLVYSDLGSFPVLEERSERYAILQTITVVAIGLCVVVRSIFNGSKRKF